MHQCVQAVQAVPGVVTCCDTGPSPSSVSPVLGVVTCCVIGPSPSSSTPVLRPPAPMFPERMERVFLSDEQRRLVVRDSEPGLAQPCSTTQRKGWLTTVERYQVVPLLPAATSMYTDAQHDILAGKLSSNLS